MKKFLKDTRGVVMMEYIILGLFAVAVTVVAVHVLGKTYNNGLLAMARATLGNTTGTVQTIADAAGQITAGAGSVQAYAEELTTAAGTESAAVDYAVYVSSTAVTP